MSILPRSAVLGRTAARKVFRVIGSTDAKILYVINDDPTFVGYGSAQRNQRILKALNAIGQVDIVWICSAGTERILQPFDRGRIACLKMPPPVTVGTRLQNYKFGKRQIERLDRVKKYDIVVTRYISASMIIPSSLFSRLIIDCDDYVKSTAGANLRQKLFNWVRTRQTDRLLRKARHVWLCSEDDVERARKVTPRVSLLRNVVTPFAPKLAEIRSGKRVIMVGAFNYGPNLEALRWFVQHVFVPVRSLFPELSLHAIGLATDEAQRLASDDVHVRGYVDDLHAEYALADVVICPVLSGGGTQIKVIEALISERPLLCSRFSYVPFAPLIEEDRHLMVADTPEEWQTKLKDVLQHPERYAEMAKEGRKRALQVFGVEAFDAEVAGSLRRVLGKAASARVAMDAEGLVQ